MEAFRSAIENFDKEVKDLRFASYFCLADHDLNQCPDNYLISQGNASASLQIRRHLDLMMIFTLVFLFVYCLVVYFTAATIRYGE